MGVGEEILGWGDEKRKGRRREEERASKGDGKKKVKSVFRSLDRSDVGDRMRFC